MTETGRPFGRISAPLSPFRSLSLNERRLLSLLQRHSPISRAELARRSEFALPTVSRLYHQLIQEGLIATEAKKMMGRRGQPSLPLVLAGDGAYAFGIAVRPDQLSVALVDLAGRVLKQIDEPLETTERAFVVRRIAALTTKMARKAAISPSRVAGMGLALPGFFIGDPPRINAPLGMDDWAVAELEDELANALGVPVLIENDGSAAAVGERIYGHGQHNDTFAYLYIDRGLGGGVVQNGELQRGRDGNAGEFTGLIPPPMRANRPTLALFLELARDDGMEFGTITQMLAAFDPAWPCVERWVEMSRPAFELVISAAAAIINPDLIVVGGRAPASLIRPLISASDFYSVPVRGQERPFPALECTGVPGDAAALGAVALVFKRLFF